MFIAIHAKNSRQSSCVYAEDTTKLIGLHPHVTLFSRSRARWIWTMHFVCHFVSNFKSEIVAVPLDMRVCLAAWIHTHIKPDSPHTNRSDDGGDDDHSHTKTYTHKSKAYTTIFKLICVKKERKLNHQSRVSSCSGRPTTVSAIKCSIPTDSWQKWMMTRCIYY